MFYPSNPELRSLGIESLGPDYPILDSYQNKTQINEFLRKNGYPVPETYEQDALFDEREYFVKPIDGVGSVGAIKLSGGEIKSQEFLKQHIIQELCFGPEVTVECFKYNDFFLAYVDKEFQPNQEWQTKSEFLKIHSLRI